jgi:3-hydroxybutyrate dehydrogenase
MRFLIDLEEEMNMLKGRSAIVTGSTSGIGLGIAQSLARAGANVMLNGFGDAAEIEKTCKDLVSWTGVQIAYSDADMTKPAAIAGMVREAEDRFGAIDILVNNAGIQHVAPVDTFPDEKWEQIVAINLSSNFYAIKAVLPGMRLRNTGRIINIASAHGLVASPFKAAYVAAKHGVVGLTKTVALERCRKPASPATRSVRAMYARPWWRGKSGTRPRRMACRRTRWSERSFSPLSPTSVLSPWRN